MNMLMIICLIGFALFVIIILYTLFANESELDRMEEEWWKKHNERSKRKG